MMASSVYPTAEFKKMAQYYVFVKINTDQQPALAQRFKVTGLPTILLMKPDESIIKTIIGSRPLNVLLQEMEAAKG